MVARACSSAKEALMDHGLFPFRIVASHPLRNVLGRDLQTVAVLAMRALLAHRKSLEVAHQQLRYRKHHIAFSSRISPGGNLVLELDVGDPRLADVLVLEADLRRAGEAARKRNGKERQNR
jgi:hypothetical protein